MIKGKVVKTYTKREREREREKGETKGGREGGGERATKVTFAFKGASCVVTEGTAFTIRSFF